MHTFVHCVIIYAQCEPLSSVRLNSLFHSSKMTSRFIYFVVVFSERVGCDILAHLLYGGAYMRLNAPSMTNKMTIFACF